jgi:hypothetical protein
LSSQPKLAEPGTGLKVGYFLDISTTTTALYADIALVAADAAYASLLSIQIKISSTVLIVLSLAWQCLIMV